MSTCRRLADLPLEIEGHDLEGVAVPPRRAPNDTGAGASGVPTFLRGTLPLIAPGVLAAALLAFALSIDDFVITSFNAGPMITYPIYIWGTRGARSRRRST